MSRTARLVIAFLLTGSLAEAEVGDWNDMYTPGRAARRSGFAAGFTTGVLAGSASGYPLKAEKIGDPAFQARTGAAGGAAGGLWIGGAVRDFLVVGAGIEFGSIAGGDGTLSNGGVYVLHVEGFPLFSRGGVYRDLALVGEFGLGNRDVWVGSTKAADGGTMSYVGLGVLWEPVRVGAHLSLGPILAVGYQWSDSLTATLVTGGIQIAYYGGPG